jgi:hypothetical protein
MMRGYRGIAPHRQKILYTLHALKCKEAGDRFFRLKKSPGDGISTPRGLIFLPLKNWGFQLNAELMEFAA